jgi:hypothetical protein
MRLHPRATDETDRLRRSARTPFLLSLDCSVSAFIFASLPGGVVVAEARYRHLLVTCDVTGTLGDIALVTFDAMTVPLRPHRRATASNAWRPRSRPQRANSCSSEPRMIRTSALCRAACGIQGRQGRRPARHSRHGDLHLRRLTAPTFRPWGCTHDHNFLLEGVKLEPVRRRSSPRDDRAA